MRDRKTEGIGCQFLVNDEQKRRWVEKIAISENRTRISSVEEYLCSLECVELENRMHC